MFVPSPKNIRQLPQHAQPTLCSQSSVSANTQGVCKSTTLVHVSGASAAKKDNLCFWFPLPTKRCHSISMQKKQSLTAPPPLFVSKLHAKCGHPTSAKVHPKYVRTLFLTCGTVFLPKHKKCVFTNTRMYKIHPFHVKLVCHPLCACTWCLEKGFCFAACLWRTKSFLRATSLAGKENGTASGTD